MITTKKVSGTATPMPLGIAAGVMGSVLITCVFVLVLTWAVFSDVIDEVALGYCLMVGVFIASAMGGLVAMLKVKRRCIFVGLATSAIYYLALLGMTVLFFGGSYSGIVTTGVLILLGGACAGMLFKIRGNKERPYKKYRHC